MASKPDVWMPLFFGDYLADTLHLTTEHHGAYFLLLMAAWKRGGALPDDDSQLAAIAKLTLGQWRKARPVIASFWRIADGEWTQKRLCRELESAKSRSKTASENGGKGGRPPKAKGNPNGNQNESATQSETKAKPNPGKSSSPSPSQSPLPAPASKKNKGNGSAQAPFVLPDWIPVEHWNAWIEARTKAKKPPTDYAKRLAVLKLENLKEQGHPPAQVLMDAAFNNWSGLFPPKEVR